MPKKIKLKNATPEFCIHDIKNPGNTLKFIENFRTMVYPPHRYAICMECGEAFEFIQDAKGEFKLKEED